MRWGLLVAVLVVLVVGGLGYVSGVRDYPVITVSPPVKVRPTLPGPVTSLSSVGGAGVSSVDVLWGYELFFWNVYGDTVFYENYLVLKRDFGCKAVRLSTSAPVDSLLRSYYMSLFSAGGDVESYLAMRDYPVVRKVVGDVPSPRINPILYAEFERGSASAGKRGNREGYGPLEVVGPSGP